MAAKILIVDDALFMRQLVRNLLKEFEYDVVGEAANGKEAIAKYFELKPDLMICDVVMPEMNGLDAIEAIIKKDPAAKIVMLSALDEQETVINALHNGAKDYLVKPVQKKNFIRTIQRVLAVDDIQNQRNILLEVYSQIFDDLENYIESALSQEILTQISYILRSVEMDNSEDFYYDEKRNRVFLQSKSQIEFSVLNSLLIALTERIKAKVETYIPYAKNIIIEAFRFVYLRNKKMIGTHPIEYPAWLESEVKFVNDVMSYLF
ncbi:Protein-glutamate methylesterase/protein-glutamine glutaminase [Candidatus Lokiarchaeum ossiferum]|uniref:Protein-glutamate methylesterase/protein-glutamine glutaminase n=1 Tax=Candidatus Lokiarchaeum ossiferum TaxID=2951803 RepID=A0ABY6HQL8_9ARCH|nr:Protein-glutamate methylesterase/protein-glutamine glutaminase [Candidatus Lokiarchaeum sp. B-35]